MSAQRIQPDAAAPKRRRVRGGGLERVPVPKNSGIAARKASAAQDALLARVWQEHGKQFRTVNQAIAEGYLTDDDWVDALDKQREDPPLRERGLTDEAKAARSKVMREFWARKKP